MALYPDDMTYEEMLDELARLVALMIVTDSEEDEDEDDDNDDEIPKTNVTPLKVKRGKATYRKQPGKKKIAQKL